MKLLPVKKIRRNSQSKLLVMKTQLIENTDEKRPSSHDSAMRRKNQAFVATDWINSKIYSEVNNVRKVNSADAIRDLDIKFNQKFPETDLDIYTDMEVTYNASLLKLKSHDHDIMPLKELKQIFNKAMRTLK